MTTLEEAWEWYESAQSSLAILGRIAENHWDSLPWTGDTSLARDHKLRTIEGEVLLQQSRQATKHMDDLAILVLFSVFESEVRQRVLETVDPIVNDITHPVILHAIQNARDTIESGSFFKVLEPFKRPETSDLIEQVNQIRRYRNWVAHGRRGEPTEGVNPRMAYVRLRQLLDIFRSSQREPYSA